MLITLTKSTDSGAAWPGFPSHLQYTLAELSWDSHLISLSLSCLINDNNSPCLEGSTRGVGKAVLVE